MIQRIQTLYLLVVTALQTILFFSTQASFISTTANASYSVQISSTWPMAALIGLTALLAFFTIFLYRRRLLQIRLAVLNGILLLVLQGFIVYYLYRAAQLAQESSYSFTAIFPILSVVLCYMAVWSIGKDEAMVRSLNRIR